MERDHNSNQKILVVDDEEDIRWIIRMILERAQFHVVEASDGAKAMEMLARDAGNEISCVITDYLMPQMNGLQLCKQLRERYGKQLSIFLITACLEQERYDKVTCFDEKFMKPLDFNDMVAKVKTHVHA
jgi:DNA-binding response OmpR family regulator